MPLIRTLSLCTALGTLVAAEPPPPAPGLVRLETGDPVCLVRPGREADLALVVTNPLDLDTTMRLTGTVRELDGPPIAIDREIPIASRAEIRLPVPLGDGRTGIRYLDYVLTVDGRKPETGQRTFVYAQPSTSKPDPAGFLYGVSSHPDRRSVSDQERATEMLAASRAGLRVMRIDATWATVEPKPGAWDFSIFDRLVELGGQHGVELEMILSYGVAHAASPATTAAFEAAKRAGTKNPWLIISRSAPEDGPWRTYARTMATRYRGQVRLWEVWNEPDLAGFFAGTTDEYIRMLRSAYAELKQADPSNIVLSGGFATVEQHGGRSKNPDLQEQVLARASDAFDIHAYHGHGPFTSFRQAVEGELARIRAGMPQQRPLYFNETALTSSHNGERLQAWTLVKKLAYARSQGAVGYTWYDLRNDGWDPGDAEHNYGMLLRDFRPKAVYAACIELTRRMHGLRCIGTLPLGEGRYGIAFAGQGRRLLVVWNEDASLGDEPIALRLPGAAGAAAVDLMGNASPLPTRGGVVLIRPGAAPGYIELPGGEAMPEVAGRLIAIAGEVSAAPGERVRIPIHLANPIAEALSLDLSWDEAGKPVVQRVDLPAGGGADIVLDAACPPDASWSKPAAMSLRYAAVGGPWSGTVTVPILTVQRVAAAPPATRPADFTIDGYASVVNFFEADPAQQRNTWQGPSDLSARIWLARGGQALHVHAEVRDDIHHQAESAVDSWRGDGIQFALAVPGQRGFWELGAACANDGRPMAHAWIAPDGMRTDPSAVSVEAVLGDGSVAYDITLPYAAFGLDDAVLERGVRFNLIVNDNDGGLRKGFIRVAPGIGERKDPASFPLVRFAKP